MRIGRVCAVLLVLAAGAEVRASDVDSEHMFGFTEGADIGKAGEREAESENIGHLGKAAGRYAVLMQNDSVKMLPTDNLRLSANVMLAHFGIAGVPDLADRELTTLQGASFEARYMVMNRRSGPFGLTAVVEPRWSQIDANSGEKLTAYGSLFTLVADKELIDDRLLGTFNVLYDAQTTRFPVAGNWVHDSKIGVAAALSARVTASAFVGGELRYLRAYDGLGLDAYSGQALFAGPTFYVQLAHGMALSGAWNVQVSGRSTAGGPLDLAHFERHQVKLRFNSNF
ncbi:hypothetical protein [Bradyrhizobium sp. STM 3809]|uniref:hypothetical protein n=1 Tax=Bradyrhizobium sp. STM 3809 TaxID=551936 RepID=UPI0002409D1E|nr:hypothetical protein [Bradyrhizobium sp. STM 3809]CCE01680.1 conserved exported hypothetical protein [Bradyrhizobium sp. STM 3809]